MYAIFADEKFAHDIFGEAKIPNKSWENLPWGF